MNIKNAIIGICSLMFFMVGVDKFLLFLEPPCSLMESIPTIIWKVLGIMQIAAGFLIWVPNVRKFIVGFFMVFMVAFSIVHLTQNTSDIGGSVFMAILLGILVWNPRFIRGRSK